MDKTTSDIFNLHAKCSKIIPKNDSNLIIEHDGSTHTFHLG